MHRAAKHVQVISRRGTNENLCEERERAKHAKLFFIVKINVQNHDVLVAVVVVVA